MWFGTEDGLNKYDGYTFQIYRYNHHDPHSISSSYISTFLEDRRGNLWIGTVGGGLNLYDRDQDRFIRYPLDDPDGTNLGFNYIHALIEDHSGRLWIGYDTGGLACFDPKSGTLIEHYKTDDNLYPNSLGYDDIWAICEDHQHNLWIGTLGSGLDFFDRQQQTFTHFRHDPDNPASLSSDEVWCVFEDSQHNVWIGASGGGLNLYDRKNKRFIHYQHNPDDKASLNSNVIFSILEDHNGNLWVGTETGGLNLFDREKGVFVHFENDTQNTRSLSHNSVECIYEEDSGTIWVGTYNGGVNFFNRDNEKFAYYRLTLDQSSQKNNVILSFCEDRSGGVWIGTDGGGLVFFDRNDDSFVSYQHDAKDKNSLSDNVILSLAGDKKGNLWIGTYAGGLNRFNRKNNTFIHYKHDVNNLGSLSDNDVRAIYEDRKGNLWIGTNKGGLNLLDRTKGTFIHYRHDEDDPDSLSSDSVYSIFEDSKGDLWIGTYDGGLNCYHRESKTFVHYRHDVNDPKSLSGDRIFSIIEDSQSRLWIGTASGLNEFIKENKTFTCYRIEDGLPNDVINGMLEDNQGNLWLSTDKGLSRFNPLTENFRNYDLNEGLQGNLFKNGAALKTRKGEMFFGGTNGFNTFYPDRIKDNPYIPPVVITDFQVFNKSVPVGKGTDGRSILKKSITEAEGVELSYKDDVFSFEFASLNYDTPEKNRYAYMMSGIDKDWNYVGNRRFATYINLPPGEYVFKVKGSNNDGVWNEEGVSLRIKVIPPFWQTWWFRGSMLITVLLMISMAYKVRTHAIRERNIQLEVRVEKRTSELEQEIIERKKLEQEAEHRAAQASLIYEVGKRVSGELELNELLSVIVNTVCHTFSYYGVMLMLFDKENKHLTLKAIAGGHAEIMPKDLSVALGEGMIGHAAASGKTHWSGNVNDNPNYIRKGEEITRSELSVPIKSGDKVIGVLDIQSNHLNAFNESDVAAMETLSTQIATAIENARLYQEAQREITVRKRVEERLNLSLKEKEVLLKEIHHRVKNNMQIISSLLRLQSWQVKNKKMQQLYKASQDRIRSMALIHEKLYQSEDLARIDFSDYVRSLTGNLFSVYRVGMEDIDIKLDLNKLYLDVNTAIPLGLIINELVSNSLKHAFPEERVSRKGGKICLSLSSNGKGEVKLIISDNGVGLPKDFDFRKAKSLGLQLVNDLVEQLDGSLQIQRKRGTAFKITFHV